MVNCGKENDMCVNGEDGGKYEQKHPKACAQFNLSWPIQATVESTWASLTE